MFGNFLSLANYGKQKINDKNDIGNRPFYYSEIYVDPQNENRVYSVFTYVNVFILFQVQTFFSHIHKYKLNLSCSKNLLLEHYYC